MSHSRQDELDKFLPSDNLPSIASRRIAGPRPNATVRGPRPASTTKTDDIVNGMRSIDISGHVHHLMEVTGTVPTRRKPAPPDLPAKPATVGRLAGMDAFEHALEKRPVGGHGVSQPASRPEPVPSRPLQDSSSNIPNAPVVPPVPTIAFSPHPAPLRPAAPPTSGPSPSTYQSWPSPVVSSPGTPPGNERVNVPNPLYSGVRCAGCDKPLSGMMIKTSTGRWHSSCFKCNHCGQALEYVQHYEKDGVPYCALDYHELFSERCAYCNTPIEEKFIAALDKRYHIGHFFCRECGVPFDETSTFMVQDGHPYCEEDYLAKFGHKCMGCGESISGEFLGALGGEWHKKCFVCADCGKAFTSSTFYVRNKKPFCELHYKKPSNPTLVRSCHRCGDPIESNGGVTAFGRNYHTNHFRCIQCDKALSARVPGLWQEGPDGQVICKMCARSNGA